MNTEAKRIRIESDRELAHLLDEADGTPVFLEKDGEVYRLTKEVNQHGEKPALSDEDYRAFRSAPGGWADVDTERLKAAIYESRRRVPDLILHL